MMPRCDIISELPEPLITKILSCLPTKHSVKTSAMEESVANLVISFFDRLLEFNPDLLLLKVKVKCGDMEIEGLKDRISTVIQRGTQHLDIEGCTYYIDPPYPNLSLRRTLVSLKLLSSGLEDPGFVSMPCLKSMTLVQVHFRDDVSLERFLSGCPLLEELTLIRDKDSNFVGGVDRFMRVRSGSLRRFRVPPWYGKDCSSFVKCTIEIDALGLEHMTLGEDQFGSIVVKNLDSLFMVDLDIKFVTRFGEFFDLGDLSKRNEIRYFFSGISSVRHTIISEKTVKKAVFLSKLLQFLPAFLECCPNLKHLILEVYYSREEEDAFELTDVPGCFLSTLECVQLKRIHEWEEEEMKVATYFLENAAVLKKLTLSLTNYPRYVPDEEIFEEVNGVDKRSPTCQILADWDLC
ncbi:hypothetical protein Bca52824_006476 [Brassica carinata]|uniref:FBD domain-containing protein n=1 Tax=Brassica carinata TaxID=52824 RepID=A0A8X7W4H1_BRACI|nr:hypothetical protein Bca52824_006476 [Brassica carinata]